MYRTMISSTLIIVLLLLVNGCSSKDVQLNTESMEREARAQSEALRKRYKQEQMHKAIMTGGEDAGWRMTPFKSNAIVAEFIEDDYSISTTVIFDRHAYKFFPECDINDLSDAIDDRLAEY